MTWRGKNKFIHKNKITKINSLLYWKSVVMSGVIYF
jgi:hypothetical protein